MGGCESATDAAEIPRPLSVVEQKFKSIEKRILKPPAELARKLEMHTSNGKITDYVTNNGVPMKFTYQQLNIEDYLDG